MNRYVTDGIIEDARAGKLVVLVVDHHEHADAVRSLVARATGASDIRRANGAERIAWPSAGTVHVRSWQQGVRGMLAHVLVITDAAYRALYERDAFEEFTPAIATGGDLVRL